MVYRNVNGQHFLLRQGCLTAEYAFVENRVFVAGELLFLGWRAVGEMGSRSSGTFFRLGGLGILGHQNNGLSPDFYSEDHSFYLM